MTGATQRRTEHHKPTTTRTPLPVSTESHYISLLESLPLPVLLIRGATILRTNIPGAHLFGYACAADLIGKDFLHLFPEKDQGSLLSSLKEITDQSPSSATIEATIIPRSEKHLHCTLQFSHLDPRDSSLVQVIVLDHTEKTQIERRSRILSALGQKLGAATKMEEAGRTIVEAADELIGWDCCYLHLYKPQGDSLINLINIDLVDGQKVDFLPCIKHPSQRMRQAMQDGGQLILRTEPLSSTPEFSAFGNQERISASMLIVPVRTKEKCIGILSIQSYTLNAYSQESLGILQILADHCAGALERLQIEEERKRVEQCNTILLRLGRSLSSASTEKEAARIIVEAASELFNWDACTLSLFQKETQLLNQLYVADTFDGERTAITYPADVKPSELSLKVMRDGPHLVLRQPEEIGAIPTVPFGNTARRSASLMFVPIRDRNGTVGFFSLQSYSFNAYNDSDLEMLQSLADHCSGALARLQADTRRKKMERQSLTLSRLGKDLSAATTPKEAAQIIMGAATELFAWDSCTIDLYLHDSNLLSPILVMDTVNGQKTVLTQDSMSPPSTMAQRVLQNGAELILRTPEQLARTDGIRFGDASRLSASIMNVPIRKGQRTIGILSIQSYSLDAYSQGDLVTLESLADYCGGALERIRAESELRNSEVRFQSVWERSVDGMRVTDENGIIVMVNEAYCQLVGMKRQELEGQPFTVPYAQTEGLDEALKKYQARFARRIVQKQVTRRMKFHSGKVVDLEDTNSFIETPDGKLLLLALFRDVTAQKQLEEELRQSQKMESVGQLAGGIAHDFNNILTVISGHASLLLMDESLASSTRESIEQISRSSERAANLTRQLLAFSRKQMMQAKNLDLNEVVGDMTKILQRVLGEHICLRVSLASNLPSVHADPGMMEQVLLNLVVNARDAMPQGGSLFVETASLFVDESNAGKPSELPPGQYACLRVRDTGCGIPAELLQKIFEPFFTTKDVGKGTGLGLATVYGIVKQHHGFVQVISELNKGTLFEIFLPQSGESDEAKLAPERTRFRGGMETILLVEDEDGVRSLASSILKRLGYRVMEANSGVSAMELWNKHHETIDLVLTDLVMPDGISGQDLADRVQTLKPGVKLIFTSGYPPSSIAALGLREGITFVQKPYQPSSLAEAVRQCLDSTA